MYSRAGQCSVLEARYPVAPNLQPYDLGHELWVTTRLCYSWQNKTFWGVTFHDIHRTNMGHMWFTSLVKFVITKCYQARATARRPRGEWAFDELRRYHTRTLQLNWGPKNVHFGKTHFWDLNFDASFFFLNKNKTKYQVQFFFFL